MRTFLILLLVLASACRTTPAVEGGHHIGEPLDATAITQPIAYATVAGAPEQYRDRTLFVSATVTAVCQDAGCWMQITDGGETAMVRWMTGCGGRYAFPKDAAGRIVLIQGELYPRTNTPEEIEHMEAEAGPAVEIPAETWEFNASAVVVVD